MRRRRLAAIYTAVALTATAVACSGANNNHQPAATAPTRATTPAPAARTPIAIAATPRPGSPTPAAAAAVGTPQGCVTFTFNPLSPEDGTPTSRPAADGTQWTIPNSFMPQGYSNQNASGDPQNEIIGIPAIVRGTSDPQAAATHLQEIGFIGGRHQEWSHPKVDNLTPVIDIQHLVFQADPGAENFLKNPVIVGGVCVREESGQKFGQDTRHFSYRADIGLQGGGTGTVDGHAVLWRCGRIDIQVSMAGPVGLFDASSVDAIAQKVQTEFLKTQPCS